MSHRDNRRKFGEGCKGGRWRESIGLLNWGWEKVRVSCQKETCIDYIYTIIFTKSNPWSCTAMCNYAIRYDHDILSKLYSDQIWINYRQIIFLIKYFRRYSHSKWIIRNVHSTGVFLATVSFENFCPVFGDPAFFDQLHLSEIKHHRHAVTFSFCKKEIKKVKFSWR